MLGHRLIRTEILRRQFKLPSLKIQMASATRRGHTFAPLSEATADESSSTANGSMPMRLKGIVFDMDGTLCEPQNHMFSEMRSAVPIPPGADILDHVHSLPPEEQSEAFRKIQEIESRAMVEQVPQAGFVTLLEYLDRWGIHKGICTRNFDAPVNHLLSNHVPSHINPFSPVITRAFRPPKPSPAGILHIARAWGMTDSSSPTSPPSISAAAAETSAAEQPQQQELLPMVMVGDSIDDMIAGRDAGCLTVLLRSAGKEELEGDERTDVVIGRLDELIGLLENGLSSRR